VNKGHSLILLTNHFPFGTAESFIEHEIPFLAKAFDHIFIITKDTHSTVIRPTGKNVEVIRINPKSSAKELFGSLFLCPKFSRKIIRSIFQEIAFIQKNKLPFFAVGKVMAHDLTKGLIYGKHISNVIKKHQPENVTLYSYWLNSSALATIFVSPASKISARISRAHGGDVYEVRNPLRYLSFRTVLAKNLTRIITISEDARRHLIKITGENYADKIKLSRLGTSTPRQTPDTTLQEPYVLVSCSFMVSVKRIHLIIEALSLLNNLKVQWIHFGDGPLKKDLTSKAEKMLSGKKNISYELRPSLPNQELIRFYEHNQVHLFINVSSSEGIPVSIMEAQSFGIPAIGPAVGGVPEIIDTKNGILIHQQGDPLEILNAIAQILTLPPPAYFTLRENARRNWELKFSADQNFPSFVAEIRSSEENKTHK
jgi:glycosyltransferase involved in cell wall biosynthesis